MVRPKGVEFLRAPFVAVLLAATLGLWMKTAAAQEGVVPVRKVMMSDGGRYFALPV